jgi:NADH-quinone oxidoreductase subunit M
MRWMVSSAQGPDLGLWIDPLAAVMMVITTSISLITAVFSLGYLHRERGHLRYFALLSAFVGGMLLLVTADGYLGLFVGWEWVGVTSALLIGFYQDREAPVRAGARAFITNRVGDVGLVLGGAILTHEVGGTDFAIVTAHIAGAPGWVAPAVGASFLLAAACKSAQWPFSSWIVHAMEGPTTTSGLFYGAVMINAGVYLLLRSAPILVETPAVMLATVAVGLITFVWATATGLTQPDAKTSLLFATLSQLGLMFMGVGLGEWGVVVVFAALNAGTRMVQFLAAPSIIDHVRRGRWLGGGVGGMSPRAVVAYGAILIGAVVMSGVIVDGIALRVGVPVPAWAAAPLWREGVLAVLVSLSLGSIILAGRWRWGGQDELATGRDPRDGAWHARALSRFQLDTLQEQWIARPLLSLAQHLARLEARVWSAERWTLVLVLAGCVGVGLALGPPLGISVAAPGSGVEGATARGFSAEQMAIDMYGLPLLSPIVAIAGLGALLVSRIRVEHVARRAALVVSTASFLLTLGLVPLVASGSGIQLAERYVGPLGLGVHLGVDGLSILLLPSFSGMVWIVLVATRRRLASRDALAPLLAVEALSLLALVSLDLLVLSVAWIASIFPLARLVARAGYGPRRAATAASFMRIQLAGAVPLAIVVFVLGSSAALHGGTSPSFDLLALVRLGVAPSWQPLLLGLLLIAVAVRLPLPPFHGWLGTFALDGTLSSTVFALGAPLPAYLLLRVALPLLPDALAASPWLLVSWATFTLVWGVLLAFAHSNVRLIVVSLWMGSNALLLDGIAAGDREGIAGTALYAAFDVVAWAGLVLVLHAVWIRTHSTDIASLGGLHRRAPLLVGFFLVLGLAAVGLPGMVGFVSEHFLTHGMYDVDPRVALFVLVAINLAGAALWWAFARALVGPPRTTAAASISDLLPRERLALVVSVAVVVGFGLFPEAALPMVERAAAPWTHHEHSGPADHVPASTHAPAAHR